MTTRPCPRCDEPIPDAGTICHACTGRLAGQLTDVPGLLAELDTTRMRQAKVATVAGYATTVCPHAIDDDCGCGVTLPWSERAADIADGLRNAVTTWTRILLDDHEHLTPPTAATAPAWLAQWTTTIRMRPWADDMAADLDCRSLAARAAIDRPADRLYAGRCGLGDPGCRFELWATIGKDAVTCPGCRAEHDVTDRREQMLEAARDQTYTAKTCALALTTVDIPVTMELISKWGHRLVRGAPKLPIAGYTPDGKPLYRLGDVRDVARGITVVPRQIVQLSSTV